MSVSAHLNSGTRQGSTVFSECNGVWTTKTWSISKQVEWSVARPSGY
ncbi:hypothetical protein [Herbidospora cretacea]|nr:hypothetical protein [Herbidospora cretacea]